MRRLPRPPHRALVAAFALGLAMVGVTPAATITAQESLLASMFPDAATLGAPSWVTVGTQVTFYAAGASVAQSQYQWVEDADGTWEDPKTGKKYRRTDESGEGVGSGAGHGYAVLDIAAMDGTQAIGSWTLYGLDLVASMYNLAGSSGGLVLGSGVDGAWIHPAILARVLEAGFGDLQVLHGPYPLDGRTYDAVSLLSDSAAGYQHWTWDLETGLLLVSSSRQTGASSPFAAPGDTPPQANASLAYRRLVGVRRRTTPGVGTQTPEWLTRTTRLTYSGTWTYVSPMDPASGITTYPMTTAATFTEGGATWANVTFRNVIDFSGNLSPSEGSSIATGTGAWWWDPGALGTMRAGQVLDEDAALAVRVTVEAIVPWQGGDSVIIRTEVPGNTFRSQFDVTSGVLLWSEIHQALQGTTISVGLDALP